MEELELYKVIGRKKRFFESKAQMKKFWNGSSDRDSKYYIIHVYQLVWSENGNTWKKIDPETV